MILILCASQTVKAQNASNDSAATVQSFRLEFNSIDGPDVNRVLQLSFSDDTSDNYDEGYDTKNLVLMQDDLNLFQEGEFYTTQAYSSITEDKIANMVFQASGSYFYSIQLVMMENMDEQSIRLRDNFTGDVFDLKSGQAYEFSSDQGYFESRFEIFFKSEETLSQTDFETLNVDVRYDTTTNSILISNPNSLNVKSVEMYNISGQRIFSNVSVNNDGLIRHRLRKINTGIYIIQLITDDNSVYTKKVVVR